MNRTLTDEDIEAIADAMKKKMVDEFYRDLGKGLWGWLKKILFAAVMGIAAYGAVKGWGQG